MVQIATHLGVVCKEVRLSLNIHVCLDRIPQGLAFLFNCKVPAPMLKPVRPLRTEPGGHEQVNAAFHGKKWLLPDINLKIVSDLKGSPTEAYGSASMI